jgi:phage tail sheath protein FI
MASALTYPGVYIEEVPSGVRTITGVATSVAAFVGWAARGPTDRAGLVLSWGDYERAYGGLDRRGLLGYAVQHFFANGGQQAYIIRLAAADADTATATVPVAAAAAGPPPVAAIDLNFSASSPGEWANRYAVQTRRRADDPARFRVTVSEVVNGVGIPVESFENLSMDPADRRNVAAVVNERSRLVRVAVTGAPGAGTAPPADAATTPPLNLGAGTDGTVLEPDTGPFEAALAAGGGAGGVNLLDRVDLFNLLCVPGLTHPATVSELQAYCRRHRAFLIADCAEADDLAALRNGPNANITGADAINAAFYFPWVSAPDPLQEGRPRAFPPSGFVAGLYAKTDAARGVWKAPAGTEASLTGAAGLTRTLTDLENVELNIRAVNCLRTFRLYGTVIWGARTLHGHNDRGSEWKYVPVRRMALFLEESLYRGTQWVVFEPNDEPLWAQIRLNIGAFLQGLFRQGAFQGRTPREAYFVKCDRETTTQDDINRGVVNIHVGFAPLRPAEFVVIRIQQMAGQLEA